MEPVKYCEGFIVLPQMAMTRGLLRKRPYDAPPPGHPGGGHPDIYIGSLNICIVLKYIQCNSNIIP